MKIPVFKIEEHHEAFLCWNEMIQRGCISSEGIYLLHLDHHDDMEGGGYGWNLNHMPSDMDEVRSFTYDVLGIADFILPSIYQGIFSEVHILKDILPQVMTSEKSFVRCLENTQLISGKYIPFFHGRFKDKPDSGYRFYELHRGGLTDGEKFRHMIEGKAVVLDVDLDYFCWDDSLSTRWPKRIEITREAYLDYQDNPYHPFRIMPKRWVHGVEDKGKYYLEYRENIPVNKVGSRKQMEKRMDSVITWFAKCELKPAAIDICRSRYSGYLPAEVFPWIEDTFMRKLGEVMEIAKI